MNKAKMIKGMVKAKKESVMGKLGDAPYDDPMEPWSAKYNQPIKEEVENLEEDSWLFSYIKSLGYNPKIMNFAQRSKYARSNAFKHWKQSHMERRPGQTATMEGRMKDTATDYDFHSEPKKSDVPFDGPYKKKPSATAGKYGQGYSTAKHLAKQGMKKVMNEDETLEEAGTGLLMNFIKAKGLNPLTMDGNQKQAYSRSSEFRIFKQKHVKETSGMGERGEDWNEQADKKAKIKEELDKADTVTMDIPLLIRVLEYAREDAKTDMDLHKVVENLIKMRDEGTLSMAQYDAIVKLKEDIESLKELKKMPDNMDADDHITREDLRQWFSKTHPEGGWKRINSKGEAIGPCAREPGEPKPKCMSNEKRAKLSKAERAAAVAAKRKHDPVADRAGKGGKPVNVSNFGKGKLGEASSPAQQAAIAIAMQKAGKKPKNEEVVDEACWDTHKQVGTKMKGGKVVPNCVPKNEEVEQIEEKNSPTNPKLWSRAKAMARSKFDVYPSAYANGWASKWYKSKGGGWKSVKEDVVQEGLGNVEDSPMSATNSVKAMESAHRKNQMKSARMIKSLYKKKVKENLYDWEKDDKPNAKIVVKGGTTMTGQPRDTIEIEPVLKTRPNHTKPTV